MPAIVSSITDTHNKEAIVREATGTAMFGQAHEMQLEHMFMHVAQLVQECLFAPFIGSMR